MISLNGQFKADIYNQNDELVEAGKYSNNYITATGLCYPLTMPFGDCFTFLSLGSGKAPNTLYTTGLQSGAAPWLYSPEGPAEYRAKCNFLWTTGVVEDSCGYRTHLSGVELYRAWRIPEVQKKYVHQDITFHEMATSPNTTGFEGFSGTTREVDQGQAAGFIDKQSGMTAFNRVLNTFTIPSGDYSIVTYKLNFIVDKEVQTFEPFIALNSAVGGTKEAWQALTGKARVMHPGIRLIPNKEDGGNGGGGGGGGGGGNDSKSPYILAKKYEFGQPLEPSSTGNMYAYFSTDNTQYRFDPFWGGKAKPHLQRLEDSQGIYYWNTTGINLATGFAEYFHNMPDLFDETNQGQDPDDATSLHHLHSSKVRLTRFNQFRRDKSILPKYTDFTDEYEVGEMGQAGYNNEVIVTNLNHDLSIVYTGQLDMRRDRDLHRIATWQGQNAVGDPGSPGTYIKYKSLVFCADAEQHRKTISTLGDEVYAFFDSQFGTYDSTNHPANGQYLVNYTTGKFVGHKTEPYGANDDLPTYSQPPKDFPAQDNQNGLSVTWKLAWSSPCHDCAGSCTNNADPAFQLSQSACETAGGVWTPCVDV
jgi:hypothetical protein